ncbi:MAG: hypothetical protein D6722_12515, partial [Bacteroidetes bacterium]
FLEFEQRINRNRKGKQPLDYTGMKEFLRRWMEDIKASGTQIVDEGTLDATLTFAEPFFPLFNVKQTLYFYANGRVSFKGGSGALEVDPKEILLQEDNIIEFTQIDDKQPLAASAVHFLKVINPDYQPGTGQSEHLFFPIPLSQKGYLLFKNQIGDLLHGHDDSFHELRGHIKASEYKLVVELHLVIDDKKLTPIVKEYDLQPLENECSVIMWPDFISDKWESYYLYSEFPQNYKGTQLVPFFREADSLEPILNDEGLLVYGTDAKIDASKLRFQRLVAYPNAQLDSSNHRYDIFRANKPYAGLELRKFFDGEEQVMGYLILKNPLDESMGDRMLRDLSKQPKATKAIVGIDFGSNNSCVQYAREDGTDVKPVPFTNRRVFLVGAEVRDPEQAKIALPHELYFFQNESPANGQVKSWVHEHNSRYIVPGMEGQEIAGGVAIFKPNIHIKAMDKYTITTNAGTLHHSMKWLNEKNDVDKKTAYLRTLWLKTVADLYASGFEPSRLRWSYPGSFARAEINQYQRVYKEIVKATPLRDAHVEVDDPFQASTEAEAVANYALSTGLSLGDRNLFLGIDVGGSTSDILVIVLDRENRQNRMIKQSSLRMAAGYLMDAIQSSEAFRDAIMRYYNHPESPITIPNIAKMEEDRKTAPFFLNAIFDRLKGRDFDDFYDTLSKYEPKVFALPMYVTGMLLYYSGQLVAKTMIENDFLLSISTVNLFPFGKGGRIFDWLDAHGGPSVAEAYYNACFRGGFGAIFSPEAAENISVKKENEVRKDNKSEVARGLVSAIAAGNRVTTDSNVRKFSDIFGEEGFSWQKPDKTREPIAPGTPITAEHFRDLKFDLVFPETYPQFEAFLDIFLEYAGPNQTGILNGTGSLRDKSRELSRVMQGYITEDAEYKKALREKQENFDFKHSMLVLEGMCFLEKYLIPEVYSR